MTEHPETNATLAEGETLVCSFSSDRSTYIRSQTWLAAAAMGAGMAVLWMLDNPHVWTGAVGGLAAIAVRAFYLMSEELAVRWDLTTRRVIGPMGRSISLGEIADVKTLGSFVQIITKSGDKHLIKYQVSPNDTVQSIRNAKGMHA